MNSFRLPGFIKVIAVNIVLVTVLITLCELFVRQFVELPGKHVIRDFQLNHVWRPNSSKKFSNWIKRNPDFPEPYTHHYNAQSWIETYDVDKQKSENIYRIFYLGDSNIEGTAPMEQSVPSRVESALNQLAQKKNLDTTFEVINTGTSSYSPLLYYILFRYKVSEYNPDLVVITIAMNDVFDDWKYSQTLVVDDNGDPYAAPPRNLYSADYFEGKEGVVEASIWTRLQLFLAQNSAIYNYYLLHRTMENKEIAKANRTKKEVDPNVYQKFDWRNKHEWNDVIKNQVGFSMDVLGKVIELAQEQGAKVMVTTMPTYKQYQYSEDDPSKTIHSDLPHKAVRSVAENKQARYVDSFNKLRPFIQPSKQDYYFYYRDGHFNPRGYEIWGDIHTKALLDPRNNLLPEEIYK